LHCGNREVRLEDDAILHAIGALVWGIGLGAVVIAPYLLAIPVAEVRRGTTGEARSKGSLWRRARRQSGVDQVPSGT
jgi:hypothetical protein